MEQRPGKLYRDRIGGIKAEEVDAGLAAVHDVGPDVQLKEAAEPGKGRNTSGADVAHPERDNSDPVFSLELVQLQPRRNKRAEYRG